LPTEFILRVLISRAWSAPPAGRTARCRGTWARAESYSPAAVAAKIEAPALESAALADLLAPS